MKKIIIAFVLVYNVGLLIGQEKFVVGKMNVGKDIYEIWSVERTPILVVVNASKNIKDVPRPNLDYEPLSILEKDRKVDTARAREIVLGVLKAKLSNLQTNKDFISIS